MADAAEHPLRQEALYWANGNGLIFQETPYVTNHIPFTLKPHPFPRHQFELATQLTTDFNTLIDRISKDPDFIMKSLNTVIDHDSFTRSMIELYAQILKEGIKQPARLGLFRFDYFLHAASDKPVLQQVELNTISSSFGHLGSLTTKLHKFLAFKFPGNYNCQPAQIPENKAGDSIAKGLLAANRLYNKPGSTVLFLVQPKERNIFDQKGLEHRLANENVHVIRRTLAQVFEEGTYGPNSELLIGDKEISVVYFRAGYAPTDYPTEKEWKARALIERSLAIKTPSVDYHLIGTKKIQQILTNPGVLETYFPGEEERVHRMRSCFTGLYAIDEQDSDIVKEAISRPHDFVLKPQREGGGNNFYGEDVGKKLKADPEERCVYILMDVIKPKSISTDFLAAGEVIQADAVCEVGFFGIFLSNGKEVLLNEYGGYLGRTKSVKNNEGGVAAGFASLDSLYLED